MATPSPAFPAAVATDAQLMVANNLVLTGLLVGVNPANTILFVASTAGFVPNCLVSIDNEIIAIASIVSTPNPQLVVATGGRGFDGTTAASHSSGAKVSLFIDAWHHNALAAEVKAIEGFIGPNGQNLPGIGGFVTPVTAFTPQSPGGTLAPGNSVITLAPVPPGVNASDSHHYLYISGGTGTAEPVLITGGTAVAGAPSGTLIVNCASAHSGAWTIQSASGGLQEAIINAGITPSILGITGNITLYAPIACWPLGGSITIQGKGANGFTITRDTSMTSGDMFIMDVANQANFPWVTFQDIALNNNSHTQTGAAIHGVNIPYVGFVLFNCTISGGQYGIRVKNASLYCDNVTMYFAAPAGYKPVAGFFVEGTGTSPESTNIYLSNCSVIAYPRDAANQLRYGILDTGSDGILAMGISSGGDCALCFAPVAPDYVTNTRFDGFWTDGPNLYGVQTAGTGIIDGLAVANFYINGPTNATNTQSASLSLAGNVHSLAISDGKIQLSQHSAVLIGTGSTGQIYIENVQIKDCNQVNATGSPAILLFDNQAGVRLRNVDVTNSAGGFSDYGVEFADLADTVIEGCAFNLAAGRPSGIPILNTPASTLTNLVIANNRGVDDLIPTVATSATLPLPVNPTFNLVGTTGVTAVTGLWEGRKVAMITPDGAVTFTAGPTIGNTITSVQNVPLNGVVIGGKLYLK